MPRYLIEREVPGDGTLDPDELWSMARRSNEVVAGTAGRAHWVHSFVTDEAVTCVDDADDPRTAA